MTRGRPTFAGLILLLMTAVPATGWQSEVHTGLAQLNPALPAVPGVTSSFDAILMGQELAYACHQRHAMQTPEGWALRTYWDLVCGSTEPDAGKGLFNERNPSHQEDRVERSLNAFDAAVGQFRQTGPERYARAARRLGHCLHYLQDAGDPTKLLGPYQDTIRQRVAYHVDGLLRYRMEYGTLHPLLTDRLGQWRAEAASLFEPSAVLFWVERHQRGLAQAMAGVLPAQGEELDNLVLQTIAIAVAGQERIVHLYLQAIQQSDPLPLPLPEPRLGPADVFEGPGFESEEGPGFESEAAPRPGQPPP